MPYVQISHEVHCTLIFTTESCHVLGTYLAHRACWKSYMCTYLGVWHIEHPEKAICANVWEMTALYVDLPSSLTNQHTLGWLSTPPPETALVAILFILKLAYFYRGPDSSHQVATSHMKNYHVFVHIACWVWNKPKKTCNVVYTTCKKSCNYVLP